MERAVARGITTEEEWKKTELRWGYLSEKKDVQEEETAGTAPPVLTEEEASTPFSDADLAVDDSPSSTSASSPSSPSTSSSASPLPTSSSTPQSDSKLDGPVTANLVSHTAYLRSLASALELQSANQAKKTAKAEAAKIREGKRKGHNVAKVQVKREKVWMGWKGAKGGPKVFKAGKGPLAKLSSGRRRKYRRAAGA
jgi:hypothetical protein